MEIGNYCYICMEEYGNLKSYKLSDYNYQKNSEKKYSYQLPNYFEKSDIKFTSREMFQLECGHSTCFKCILLTINNCGNKCPFCRTKISEKDITTILKIFDQNYQIYTDPHLITFIENKKLTRKKTEIFRTTVIKDLLNFYLNFMNRFIISYYDDPIEKHNEICRFKSKIINIMINLVRKNKWFLDKNNDFKKIFIKKLDEIHNCDNLEYSSILSQFWKNELINKY